MLAKYNDIICAMHRYDLVDYIVIAAQLPSRVNFIKRHLTPLGFIHTTAQYTHKVYIAMYLEDEPGACACVPDRRTIATQ